METHIASNLVVGLLVASGLLIGAAARRNAYWRSILRDLFRRRRALIACGVFGFYLVVALCDSVSWRDGQPVSGTDRVTARAPRTLVDRFFSRMGLMEPEAGYSSPWA